MKALNHFFVKVPKKTDDTIKLGETKIFLDTRFNEFDHRICCGEILSPPTKVDTGAQVGDTLFFHHLVTVSEHLEIEEDVYLAVLDTKNPRGSHAIAYRDSKGEVHMLADWVFLEPLEQDTGEEVTESGIIFTINKKEKDEARVVSPCKSLKREGVKAGDVVGYLKDRDYKMKLDDESIVYRMTAEDITYVKEG
ncbi:MAG: hypothetical protein P8J32_00115 [bacterium]|nr:hypothetical protein [bacterium]